MFIIDTNAKNGKRTTPLVACRRLCAGYGGVVVVRDLDLHVDAGEVVALIGPNGAGKTTTLLTLSGDLPTISGEVEFLGAPARSPLFERARRGMGFVTEERSVFMRLSTADNLRLAGVAKRDATDLFSELEPLMRRRAGLLSGGEQQMLALARTLARRPRLLLADELSLGLAPLVVETLMALVARLRDELGLAVLLVEQNAGAALAVANSGYVMEHGRIVYDGTVERLLAHEDVREFYLGVGHRAGRKSYTDVKQYQRRRRWF
jgi:branched-chain amino acid transport system ATP-binding protein